MEDAPSLLCPRDNTPLKIVPSGVAGSRCASCDGLFLRSPEIAAAIRQAGVDRDKLGGIHPLPPACPGCAAEMTVFVVANLEIDRCGSCEAIWLDKGELEKVNAYLGSDPSKNVVTRLVPTADDFGILGGVYSNEMEAYQDGFGRDETFERIVRALRRFLRI
jgi:Zn-finger nucleic acid-binding protein